MQFDDIYFVAPVNDVIDTHWPRPLVTFLDRPIVSVELQQRNVEFSAKNLLLSELYHVTRVRRTPYSAYRLKSVNL